MKHIARKWLLNETKLKLKSLTIYCLMSATSVVNTKLLVLFF